MYILFKIMLIGSMVHKTQKPVQFKFNIENWFNQLVNKSKAVPQMRLSNKCFYLKKKIVITVVD